MPEQSEQIYRMKRSLRDVGIVGIVCFVGMAILSATVALLNPDGSFKHPMLAAVVFSSGFGLFSLTGWWLLLTYYRYRLLLSSTSIRQVELFRSHAVSIQSIHEAKWRLRPRSGSIAISFPEGKVKIEFDPFTRADRQRIISFLRDQLPAESHRNWEAFHERFLAPNPDRDRQQIRATQILSLVVLAFAVTFVLAGSIGLGGRYFVYSALNLAAFVWARRKQHAQS